ncbi:MAG TPA: nucleotidyltransferase family protein [Flavipsychrobacter sp.]|nr:nucleotidyltransferase family protein [Flavipsychrobacter sp.]
MDCIILAGGLGTRLRTVTNDKLPKCMAPVNGKPFLHYLFMYVQQQKAERVILSLGHRHETILDWVKNEDWDFKIDHVIEPEPLGTGGAIQLAMSKTKNENAVVLNGDTLFLCDLKTLYQFHLEKSAGATLSLKNMQEYERYGSVLVDEKDTIQTFEEKQYKKEGAINAGTYVLNKQFLLDKNLPEKFSLEKDYFEAFVAESAFFAKRFDNYFIDIGIPEDYERAQQDFLTLFA